MKAEKKNGFSFFHRLLFVVLFTGLIAAPSFAAKFSEDVVDLTGIAEYREAYLTSSPGDLPMEKEKLRAPVFTALTNHSDGILVRWEPVPHAASYIVFRKEAGGEYGMLINTRDHTFVDEEVLSGTSYSYMVQSVAAAGDEEYEDSDLDGEERTLTCLSTPGMNALTSAAAGVRITWKGVPGADRYEILRSTGSEVNWKELCTVEASDDATQVYLDNTASESGTWYAYTVRAISADGTVSGQTGGRSIKYIGPVTIEKAESISTGVRITFTTVNGGYTYRLYRSDYNRDSKT